MIVPFLSQHNSDLLALIEVMIVTFGEQPPVYAKSKMEIQQSTTPYPVQRKQLSLMEINSTLSVAIIFIYILNNN